MKRTHFQWELSKGDLEQNIDKFPEIFLSPITRSAEPDWFLDLTVTVLSPGQMKRLAYNFINPFVPNAPFLSLLKASENCKRMNALKQMC